MSVETITTISPVTNKPVVERQGPTDAQFAELPKTISGKIRRVELRTREEEQADRRIEGEWRDDDFGDLKA